MKSEDTIRASEFCLHHNLQLSFIQSLRDYELVETILVEEEIFLPVSELGRVEKIMRLHFDLEINLEGIETITYLLERMQGMQHQINDLTNRLKAQGA